MAHFVDCLSSRLKVVGFSPAFLVLCGKKKDINDLGCKCRYGQVLTKNQNPGLQIAGYHCVTEVLFKEINQD